MSDESEHIGYLLFGVRVICKECIKGRDYNPPEPVKLYSVNVYPYRQNCYLCDKELVKSQSDAWPELFKPRS